MGRGPNRKPGRGKTEPPLLPLALCRDEDPEQWFSDQPVFAVMVCRRCPELAPCQEWAVGQVGLHGVWGGLTEVARETLQKLGGQDAG